MRYIIVVQAAHQAVANALAAQVDTVGGQNTFTVPLYPAGLPQVTPSHFWCDWGGLSNNDARAVYARFGNGTPARPGILYDGDVVTPAEVLAALGIETARGMT